MDFVTSEKAYGEFLYLGSLNQQGEVTTKLLCSKSKVAPVKKITLPRLELCGAFTLSTIDTENSTCIEFEDCQNFATDRFYDCAFMVSNNSY